VYGLYVEGSFRTFRGAWGDANHVSKASVVPPWLQVGAKQASTSAHLEIFIMKRQGERRLERHGRFEQVAGFMERVTVVHRGTVLLTFRFRVATVGIDLGVEVGWARSQAVSVAVLLCDVSSWLPLYNVPLSADGVTGAYLVTVRKYWNCCPAGGAGSGLLLLLPVCHGFHKTFQLHSIIPSKCSILCRFLWREFPFVAL
jgi:hypothetical protein